MKRFEPTGRRLGKVPMFGLLLLTACVGSFGWSVLPAARLCAPDSDRPLLRHEIVRSLPHDPGAYTQGLLISGEIMFESTGRYGQSSVRRLELASGRELAREPLPARLFGEGLALVEGELYQLSWREGEVRVYQAATLQLLRKARIEGEGWGLTFDGRHLIQSDGSDALIYRDASDMSEVARVQVRAAGRPLTGLNELEYVDGLILANIYPTDCIAVIDAVSGNVVSWLDMRELARAVRERSKAAEVTNGIAYNPATDTYYLTGKFWPQLYELRLSGLQDAGRR